MAKKLKVDYGSDLHLERYNVDQPYGEHDPLEFLTPPGGDVLVLAGDICNFRDILHGPRVTTRATSYLEEACSRYERVIWVPGNHEYWRGSIGDLQAVRDAIAANPKLGNLSLLSNDSVMHGGVMFLGSTLWTDLSGSSTDLMAEAFKDWPDFRCVTQAGNRVMQDQKSWSYNHAKDLEWLEGAFQCMQRLDMRATHRFLPASPIRPMDPFPLESPVVVVTHMPPTFRSEDKQYSLRYGSQLFYAPLDAKLAVGGCLSGARYWFCGHTHSPSSCSVGFTAVLCNPAGYPRGLQDDGTVRLENPKFQWKRVAI